MPNTNKGKVNPEYKDRLFRFIFGAEENRAYLLSLCNAVGNTDYTNLDDIEITTLNDVLYIKMKNDISFLIGSQMSLYEHQSSFNPNMPIRGMQYFAELYAKYIKEKGINIYGSTLKKIPTPKYIVFYNGTIEQPDVVKLKLSSAFQVPDDTGEFEWTATMLNINYGHNQQLMERCQPLREYAYFVKLIRENSQIMSLKDAVDTAIDKAENLKYIGSFLSKCRSEVNAMLLTEFNQKSYDNELFEEGKKAEQDKRMRKMIKMNFSVKDIAELYGISEDYVKQLKNNMVK